MTTQDETPTQVAQDIAEGLYAQVEVFVNGLLRPWNAYQILIAAGLILVAVVLSQIVGRRYHD